MPAEFLTDAQAAAYAAFAGAEAALRVWVDARAWTTGEGPKALFDAAVGWLRERRVLLPGVTTPARLVASVREVANQRLWDTLYGLLSPGQRAVLDSLLTVPPGARVSELDRLRRGPVRISGPQMNQMKWALERAEEIAAFGMGGVDVSAIPPRRLAELSRYGVDGKASLLRRHGDSRRLATLLATAVHLTSRAVDDHRVHPHRRRASVRRDPHAVARRAAHPTRRRDRPLRADLQDPAHPAPGRRTRLPPPDQGTGQPPGRPPRARPEDLPRPAVPRSGLGLRYSWAPLPV